MCCFAIWTSAAAAKKKKTPSKISKNSLRKWVSSTAQVAGKELLSEDQKAAHISPPKEPHLQVRHLLLEVSLASHDVFDKGCGRERRELLGNYHLLTPSLVHTIFQDGSCS